MVSTTIIINDRTRWNGIPKTSANSEQLTSHDNGQAPTTKRIDRLTQEAYTRGYLKPDDFSAVARRLILDLVKNERATGAGCV